MSFTYNNNSVVPPVGSVIAYAGTSSPGGWLICDGSAVSRSTYSDLFTAIGTNYGGGDGSTTFNLPNLTSKFIRGRSSTSTQTGTTTTGSDSYSLTSANIPAHTHTYQDAYFAEAYGGTGNFFGSGANDGDNRLIYRNENKDSFSTTPYDINTSSYGSSSVTAVPTVPLSLQMNYIIKY